MYEKIKRGCDIFIAIIGIIISLPISLVVAIGIKATSKGKILFRQERVGKDGEIITIYKFRTMVENAENQIGALSLKEQMEYAANYRIEKDPRVTKFGRFLRQSNLDELPQFWSVLKGDMSLIGPRPILKEELEKYGDQKEKLLSVRPGATGYWQIHRNHCKSYEKRMQLELYYVEHRSIKLDSKILFQTMQDFLKKIIK